MKQLFKRPLGLGVALVLALGLAACSNDGQEEPESSPSVTTSDGSPQNPNEEAPEPDGGEVTATPTTPHPTVEPTNTEPPSIDGDLSDAVRNAAHSYLVVRGNVVSHYQESPSSWLEEIEPLMTSAGYAALTENIGDGPAGAPWNIAHENGIEVEVESDCNIQEQAGEPTDSEVFIMCALTYFPTDEDGNRLPTTQIPNGWPYVGVQQPALLQMVRDGDKWLVDADYTGQAS